MELVLHLAGIILHSGGGKVGDWGRCGTQMILWNIKGKKSTVVTLLKGIKIYFLTAKHGWFTWGFRKAAKDLLVYVGTNQQKATQLLCN